MNSARAKIVAEVDKIQDGIQHSEIDRYRAIIFPNNIRQFRKARGFESLLQLSQSIPSTTYIRLSKIERGEVFARAEELRAIANILHVKVDKLLIDVDDPAFNIAAWAEEYMGPNGIDCAADDIAVLLAAALRAKRARDPSLSIAMLEQQYGIAPVILSRIENAYKPIDRWSRNIQQSLFRLFSVPDADTLIAHLRQSHARGLFDAILPLIANPAERIAKTRTKTLKLRVELAAPKSLLRRRHNVPRSAQSAAANMASSPALPPASNSRLDSAPNWGAPLAGPPSAHGSAALVARASVANPANAEGVFASSEPRMVNIFGAPMPHGLIAPLDTGEKIEVASHVGPRAYGLRICRPSLGPGMPGRAIVIVDPDRFPSAGSLAIVRETEGLRLLAVTADRQGRLIGFSEHPNIERVLDEIAPENMATVLSAQLE